MPSKPATPHRSCPNNLLIFSIGDDAEGLVVVLGVKPHVRVGFASAAGHNAPLTPMIQAGRVHGVFAVIVTANVGELFFMVAEPFIVVLRVFVGAAGQNVVNGVHGLLRQRINLAFPEFFKTLIGCLVFRVRGRSTGSIAAAGAMLCAGCGAGGGVGRRGFRRRNRRLLGRFLERVNPKIRGHRRHNEAADDHRKGLFPVCHDTYCYTPQAPHIAVACRG